jgi:hypothetical protein
MTPVFDNTPYIALIADIIDSKEIDNRSLAQKKLEASLNALNERDSADIASNFTITLGDEFQGLLHGGANVMRMIEQIEWDMYQVRFRFGIGIGEITTDINHESAIGSDGPAYYRAREAIEALKKNKRKKQSGEADIRIEAGEANQHSVVLLNSILSLMTVIKYSWSDRQREIIWAMMKSGESQTETARCMGITQPSVQKNLANGNYYAYRRAMKTIETALKEVGKGDV